MPGCIDLITLMWVSLEISFPFAELEYRSHQFWSKVMTSEVEQRPALIKVDYGWHRRQWLRTLPPFLTPLEQYH